MRRKEARLSPSAFPAHQRRAKLEKMMAPYRAIEEAGAKGKKGGVIGHSGLCVLEAFLTFRLRRPGESLHMSREAIARAALLSPRTVGRTIQRLADLGLITVQGGKVYEIQCPGMCGAGRAFGDVRIGDS